jgi:hypothetical protein
MSEKLHIALVMRLFSSQGGLELYALKLIEGLLGRGHKVTVICEIDESNLSHANLVVQKFAGAKKGSNKWQKIEHYRKVATAAVESSGPFRHCSFAALPTQQRSIRCCHFSQPYSRPLVAGWLSVRKAAQQLQDGHSQELQIAPQIRLLNYVKEH